MTPLRLCVFAPYLPDRNAGSAGSGYFFDHVATQLAMGMSVVVVAPAISQDIGQFEQPEGLLGLEIIAVKVPPLSKSRSLMERAKGYLCGMSLSPGFASAIRDDDRVRSALANADLIEFQWVESAVLRRRIKDIGSVAQFTIVAHDVLAQRNWRAAVGGPSLVVRAARMLRQPLVARAERRAMRAAMHVITLNTKDAQLVVAKGISPSQVSSVDPPIGGWVRPPANADSRERTTCRVLFVGAMSRWENEQAVRWFANEIWPTVREAVSGARFRVVGSGVSEGLRSHLERDQSIEIVGFVEDLAAEYAAAAVSVVPLRSGAGVKFKTIEAALSGVPLVATSIGLEGVPIPGTNSELADDAGEFAARVIERLVDAQQARDRAMYVQEWAQRAYCTEKYEDSMRTLYSQFYACAEEPRG